MVLAIQTPEQVQQNRDAEAKQTHENANPALYMQPAEDALAGYVRKCWLAAKSHKQSSGLNDRLADCLRRRKGEYSPSRLTEIQQTGGSEIFMQLTAAKCRGLKAWLADLFAPAGDRPWDLSATPVPELPPEIIQQMIQEAMAVMQQSQISQEEVQATLSKHKDRLLTEATDEAQSRMDKMADLIEDDMVEGDWDTVFDAFLDDFVTFPVAYVKGVEFTTGKKLQWVPAENGGFAPQTERVIQRKFRRVSPFRAYPAPSADSTLDGHWFIEHRTFTRKDLSAMRGAPGYHTENIALVLAQYSAGGLREWVWSDEERAILNNYSMTVDNGDTIDALEWEGSLSGQMLLDWGMDQKQVPDPHDEYQVSITIVGNFVIRAMISADPAGKSDIHCACWETVPGSLIGKALPETMADCQDTCNAAARSLINNMAMSSGPQVWVDMGMMADNADASAMWPWKVWHGDSSGSGSNNSSRPGINFFQPQSNANELMQIYERFSKYADELTGLPAYAYGSDQGAGAAKTASGYSMMMNATSKTIKNAVRTIDRNIIERIVEKLYNHFMLFHPDPEVKGDAQPKAKGSDQLIQKEAQAMRQQEMLGMTANPIDMQIIGMEGRRKQLEQFYKANDTDSSDIIPDAETLKQRMAAQMQGPQEGAPSAQPAA